MGDSLVEDVLSYFDPASLVLLSSSSSANYCSALDHLERGDSKLPEVIYIDDSPQLEEISSVSGETITPCPSISEDDGGVQEIFVSSRPLSLLDRDGIEEVNNSNFELSSTRTPTKETPLEESTAKDRLCYVQDEDHTDSLSIVQSRIPLRNFIIPCLQTVNTLKSRYGSRYKLNVKLRKVAGVRPKKFRTKLYKFKKDLHQELDDWEAYLNEQSPNEAYIAVENTVDNEGPPRDFTYITHNILHQDISHLFDINYLVGCSCKRVCTRETCECPSNSGGKFAYDRSGKVLVEPGTPIYECNSRCPCGLSCRNRVVQRGRTVKVAIFRTPNGCGWGVKTMDPIEKNQLVTEYVGEAITQEEAEERGKVYDSCGSTYLFDLDFNAGECLYTLDAKKYGNISHFVNHSCDPNLSVYAIWVDTLDPNFPRIALVASRNIKVGEELTFDYQMTSSEVSGSGCSPRKRNNIRCHCGAENCRTYLC